MIDDRQAEPRPSRILKAQAVSLVRQACAITRAIQHRLRPAGTLDKEDRTPVTVGDFSVQAVISLSLLRSFPSIPLLAEEDDAPLRQDRTVRQQVLNAVNRTLPGVTEEEVMASISRGRHPGGEGRFWVLDPIDGTRGFIRGDQYAVCLALVDQGRVLLSVIGCPELPFDPRNPRGERGCLVVAERGGPATIEPLSGYGQRRELAVSSVKDPAAAAIVSSAEAGHADHELHRRVARSLGITRATLRLDSQVKFVVLARGEAEIFLRFASKPGVVQKIWDTAPGALVVECAGGKVVDLEGQALDYTAGRTMGVGSLYATNGHLHEAVACVVGLHCHRAR